MGKSLRIGTFIPIKLLNNALASNSLKSVNFLLLQTAYFDKSITLCF